MLGENAPRPLLAYAWQAFGPEPEPTRMFHKAGSAVWADVSTNAPATFLGRFPPDITAAPELSTCPR